MCSKISGVFAVALLQDEITKVLKIVSHESKRYNQDYFNRRLSFRERRAYIHRSVFRTQRVYTTPFDKILARGEA